MAALRVRSLSKVPAVTATEMVPVRTMEVLDKVMGGQKDSAPLIVLCFTADFVENSGKISTALTSLASQYGGRGAVFISVHIGDSYEGQELIVAEYGIEDFPSLLFLNPAESLRSPVAKYDKVEDCKAALAARFPDEPVAREDITNLEKGADLLLAAAGGADGKSGDEVKAPDKPAAGGGDASAAGGSDAGANVAPAPVVPPTDPEKPPPNPPKLRAQLSYLTKDDMQRLADEAVLKSAPVVQLMEVRSHWRDRLA